MPTALDAIPGYPRSLGPAAAGNSELGHAARSNGNHDWPDQRWLRPFRRRLRHWFGQHQRDLPWRRTRDPYAIWVSEIMLQQTQVATVKPFFEAFMRRFASVTSLAAAEEDEVLRLWEGLGYYRRARQLHAAARQIVARHAGQFPRDMAAVLALPGIGRYTAGAILSIAWDRPAPILEANTLRLYSRLLGFPGDPRSSSGQSLLWQFARHLLPVRGSGQINQALMDLGSLVCTPRRPACPDCPVAQLCGARALGLQHQIPRSAKRPVTEQRREVAIIVRRRRDVLLRRCADDERWAGLWDFPRVPAATAGNSDAQSESQSDAWVQSVAQLTGFTVAPGRHLATLKHTVTRFRITLDCYLATVIRGPRLRRGGDLQWVPIAALDTYPLSVTGRKIANRLAQDA